MLSRLTVKRSNRREAEERRGDHRAREVALVARADQPVEDEDHHVEGFEDRDDEQQLLGAAAHQRRR